ncbi:MULTISPECIES: hypothetical protein [Bartonella]|uniref:hypothetical protein n=1 Tax=Bartonella TaxID=773 RepID=UPI0011AB2610|nr:MULTISPECIES: hypothetical protein [Bartonella]
MWEGAARVCCLLTRMLNHYSVLFFIECEVHFLMYLSMMGMCEKVWEIRVKEMGSIFFISVSKGGPRKYYCANIKGENTHFIKGLV